MLAEGVGLPPTVQGLLAHLTERWDGKGPLGRAKGEEIPLPMRIVHVAVDATFQRLVGGEEHARRLVRERAGGGLDPVVAACLADDGGEILALDAQASAWEEVLACEPQPRLMLEGEAIDRALEAVGGFADLISPYLAGHSAGVAELATRAAERCRLGAAETIAVRRAALVHDLGRVAVGARTWQKPGRLTADEWEQVRLHPYHTERVRGALAVLVGAGARRRRPPRAPGRVRLPPRLAGRGSDDAGPRAGRRRRLSRDDRATARTASRWRRNKRPTSSPGRRAPGGWTAML